MRMALVAPDEYSVGRSWKKVVVEVLNSSCDAGDGYGSPGCPFAFSVVDECLVYGGGFVDVVDECATVGDHLRVIGNDDRLMGEYGVFGSIRRADYSSLVRHDDLGVQC